MPIKPALPPQRSADESQGSTLITQPLGASNRRLGRLGSRSASPDTGQQGESAILKVARSIRPCIGGEAGEDFVSIGFS